MSKAFIKTNQPVPRALYVYVDALAAQAAELGTPLSSDSIHLFKHILACTLVANAPKNAPRFPVSAKLIKNELPDARWKDLRAAELIEASDYHKGNGLSRHFKLTERIHVALFEILPAKLDVLLKEDRVNLFSGRKVSHVVKSQKRELTGAKMRDEQLAAMSRYRGTTLSKTGIEGHLAFLAAAAETARGTPEFSRAQARYCHDLFCFQSLASQNLRHLEGDLYIFEPAFFFSYTGRLFQVGGGLQGASGAMKAAAYGSQSDVFNYDVKASQTQVLLSQFRKASRMGMGLDPTWIESYLKNPDAKHDYARKVGIDVETWKDCLYALMMGASSGPDGAIAPIILDACDGNGIRFNIAYEAFINEVAPLRKQLSKWHTWLLEVFLPQQKCTGKSGMFIRNAFKAQYYFENDLKHDPHACKRRLAAHLLQGQERHFIDLVEQYAIERGCELLMPEHDGVVVRNKIPNSVIIRAGLEADLPGVQMVVKPFKSAPKDVLRRSAA